MIFSTKAGYSLRAMVCLAKNYAKKPYSLHKIAEEECISLGYLERLVKKLKEAGLVKSEIGSSGGYRLNKNPGKITVADIVEVAEGKLSNSYCVGGDKRLAKCPPSCLSKKVWHKLDFQIKKTLQSITLAELVK